MEDMPGDQPDKQDYTVPNPNSIVPIAAKVVCIVNLFRLK